MSARLLLHGALFAMVLCAGCTTTETIRRTALIPAAYLPSRIGEPLDELQVRVQGEVNPVRLSNGNDPVSTVSYDTVNMGDPGLLIPRAAIGGSVYFAPIRYLEFGGQFHWSSYRWTRANKRGVLDFPDGMQQDVFKGGLGLRGNFPIKRIDLTFSPILQVDFVRVPEAEFIDAQALYPGQGYEPGFHFTRIYTSTWVYPSLFLQVDKGFLDSTLHVHFIVGLQRTLENIGFDWMDRQKSTVKGAAVVPVGLGIEYRFLWFVAGATLFYPVVLGESLDASTFGPCLSLRLGAVVGGRKDAPAEGEP